ncbi:MAG: SGNH/GDSL hydrolase family protein [Phycisphaeraceae bacterium]
MNIRRMALLTLVLLLAGPVLAAPVKIMPLGDSITQGDAGHVSYRYWLWQALQRGGYDVDFVGSETENHGGRPAAFARLKPGDFDLDHEGHWGWRTDQVLEKIGPWAKVRPDIVLIHLGTNNLSPPEKAVADLSKIIDALRRENPHVTVLLAQVIPARDRAPQVVAFNQAVAALGHRKDTTGSLVKLVDQHSGFDADKLLHDGLHPNEHGEKRMAARWYAVLVPLLDKEWPIHSQPLSPRLALVDRLVRARDYGGVGVQLDEMMGGMGGDGGPELDQAASLLGAIAAYAQVQQDRVARLEKQRAHYDAAPIALTLVRQFRGTKVAHAMQDKLAAWQKSGAIAREVEASKVMQFARLAEYRMDWQQAAEQYRKVIEQFAGSRAAREARRCVDDLVERGLVGK